jgi:hypothetical protein
VSTAAVVNAFIPHMMFRRLVPAGLYQTNLLTVSTLNEVKFDEQRRISGAGGFG